MSAEYFTVKSGSYLSFLMIRTGTRAFSAASCARVAARQLRSRRAFE